MDNNNSGRPDAQKPNGQNNRNRNRNNSPRRNNNNNRPRKSNNAVQNAQQVNTSEKPPKSKQNQNRGKNTRPKNNQRRSNSRPRTREMTTSNLDVGPENAPNHKILKVAAISGTEEVGRNSNFVELGNDIVMIDCGLAFPTNEHYGIDYIIPNISYLKQNKNKIRGIVITHGHLDHIGALPYVLPELDFPTIYASKTANDIIRARLAEFKMDKRANLVTVEEKQTIRLGAFSAKFIHVTHSIPGCFAIFIESPRGNVFVSGDYKIDTSPLIENETDYETLGQLKGKVDLALLESTRASVPGHSKTEKQLQDTLLQLISKAKGRVVLASFASNISRMYIAGVIASRTGRKVFVSGRSSVNMLEMAREDGYLKGLLPLFMSETEIHKHDDNKIIFLCTGSQGEEYGALNRISRREHKYYRLKSGDMVIRSSSDIPGNELDIEKMTSRIVAQGADLVNNREVEVHYGGHGSMDDMKTMYDLIKPRNVMPVHGHRTLRYYAGENYKNWGNKPSEILMTDDGAVWSTSDGKSWKRGKQIDSKPVLVDGLGVGDVGDAVLKDREQLSKFGMIVTILNLSSKKKQIISKPRFVSRGFVYMKASKKLFDELEKIVIDEHTQWQEDSRKTGRFEYTKLSTSIEKKMAKHILKKTEREPMMLTHIL